MTKFTFVHWYFMRPSRSITEFNVRWKSFTWYVIWYLKFLQSSIFALALLYQWTKAEKAYTYFHYNKVYFQHLLEENTVCPRRPSLLIGELHLLAWTEQESHACNVNQALDRKQKHFGSHFSELLFYIIIPFRWVLNIMIRIMGMSYVHMSL